MTEVRLRAAVPADAAMVAGLMNDHSTSLGLPADVTSEHIVAWIAGDNVTALVAEADGAVAGFGDLYPRGDVVRVSATGSAAGALLDALEPRAARLGGIARIVLHESDPQRRLLAARGYRAIRDSYDMGIELDGAQVAPAWPDGVTVRAARHEDRPAFYRVNEEAFADHWGYEPRTYEEWSHLYGEVRPFDPRLWLLAEADDEPVGIAVNAQGVEGDPETGWIHLIAVRRQWRGAGLGTALLRWSFGALASLGMRWAALSVDAENTTGAVALYERAGMRVEARFETWDKSLS
jgi:ribosomal protein S18 acetylase RimI-like enzyme